MRVRSVEYPATLSRIPAYAHLLFSYCCKGRVNWIAGVEAQAGRLYAVRFLDFHPRPEVAQRYPIPWIGPRAARVWRVRRGPVTVDLWRFLDAVRAARVAGYRAARVGCWYDVLDAEGSPTGLVDFTTRELAEAAIERAWAEAIR